MRPAGAAQLVLRDGLLLGSLRGVAGLGTDTGGEACLLVVGGGEAQAATPSSPAPQPRRPSAGCWPVHP